MNRLMRNDSPGVLTLANASAREKKRVAERRPGRDRRAARAANPRGAGRSALRLP